MLTFNGILKLCAEQNAKQEAVRTFKRLQKAAVDADDDSYKLLLQCTAASGDLPLSTKVMQVDALTSGGIRYSSFPLWGQDREVLGRWAVALVREDFTSRR